MSGCRVGWSRAHTGGTRGAWVSGALGSLVFLLFLERFPDGVVAHVTLFICLFLAGGQKARLASGTLGLDLGASLTTYLH